MKKKITAVVFRFIRFWIKLFYPRIEVEGLENLPDEPCVIVGNHAKMNGPISCELYFPGKRRIWTAGQMMHLKDVPAYAYKDFWSHKPGYVKWFFKILSYVIAPFSVCIFNNAHCIGVYHDMRLMSTFRETMDELDQGTNIIIFPEHDVPYNGLVWDFQDRFIDLARMYYKRTGKEISFVPMYVAPRMKKLYLGKPIRFDHTIKMKEEREVIREQLMDSITETARALPEHTVVPYPNMPKKMYPTNKGRTAESMQPVDTDVQTGTMVQPATT